MNSHEADPGQESPQKEARRELQAAEAKVQEAVALLYTLFHNGKDPEYDPQGVATRRFTEEQLKEAGIADLLPNHGKGGIEVQMFAEQHTEHPPVIYMIQQRVQSLCRATAQEYGLDTEALMTELWPKFAERCEQQLNEIKKLNGIRDEQVLHEKSKKLMEEIVGEAFSKLFQMSAAGNAVKDYSFSDFKEKVISAAKKLRSNDASILVFNEKTKTFSFDEVISTTTAHDRKKGKPVANLSIAYDGKYEPLVGDYVIAPKVESSVVKHASLPPISAISRFRPFDPRHSNIDILIDTANHIEEVGKAMALLRQHGQTSQQGMTIDWTYQLLTTNAFNTDKQATTYGYIVKAMHAMNGVVLESNGQPFKLNANVMNAGINSLAEFNFGYLTDTQRNENRKAYLNISSHLEAHLADIKTITGPENATHLAPMGKLQKIYGDMAKKVETQQGIYNQEKTTASQFADEFNRWRKEYNALQQSYNQIANKKSPEAKKLKEEIKHVRKAIGKTVDAIEKAQTKVNKAAEKLERAQKKTWREHRDEITSAVKDLINDKNIALLAMNINSTDETVRKQATDQVLALAAVVYKSYMDELYYTGLYRSPNGAAMFNTYLSAYQHVSGLAASEGCKSANDRTYVARLFLAAMSNERDANSPLPPPYHRDPRHRTELMAKMTEIKFSHSALASCIKDNGGTPKVDSRKFKYLATIPGIDRINKFGKYASHKIGDLVDKLRESYLKRKAGSTGVIYSGLHQKPSKNAPRTTRALAEAGIFDLRGVPENMNPLYEDKGLRGVNPFHELPKSGPQASQTAVQSQTESKSQIEAPRSTIGKRKM